jgi:hypothetical protein
MRRLSGVRWQSAEVRRASVAEAEGAKESEEEHRGALMRDMQGTAVEKLAMFEKLRARGAFEGVDRRELMKLENMLRTFAAMEKV